MVHQPAVWRRKEPATKGRAVALLKEGTEFDATGEWLGGNGVPPVTGGLANCISLFPPIWCTWMWSRGFNLWQSAWCWDGSDPGCALPRRGCGCLEKMPIRCLDCEFWTCHDKSVNYRLFIIVFPKWIRHQLRKKSGWVLVDGSALGLGPLIEPIDPDFSNIWPGKCGVQGSLRESQGMSERWHVMAFSRLKSRFQKKALPPSRWAEVSEGMWRLDDLFLKRYKSMYCRCTAEATSREPQSGDMREFDWYDLDKVTRVMRWRKDCRGS